MEVDASVRLQNKNNNTVNQIFPRGGQYQSKNTNPNTNHRINNIQEDHFLEEQ